MSWKVLVAIIFFACKGYAIEYKILLVAEGTNGDYLEAVEKAEETDKDVTIIKHALPLEVTQQDIDDVCSLGRPDLVLDYTVWNMSSESMKKYSAMLRIPTITSSLGQKGDILEWRLIDKEQKKILVQIQQPADLIPYMIRAIVIYQKYRNMAVIYDKSFVMFHKMKQLMLNLKVQHVILLHDRLLRALDPTRQGAYNIFVIGKLETIRIIFNQACELRYFDDRMFSLHGITLDGGKLEVTCKKARYVLAQPVSTRNDKNQDVVFNDDDIVKATHEYFYDLTIAAMDAVKKVPRLKTTKLCDIKESEDFFAKNPVDLYKILGDFLKTKKDSLLGEPFRIKGMWNNYAFVKMQLKGIDVLNNETVYQQNIAEWTSDSTTSLQQINGLSNYSSQTVYSVVISLQEPFLFRNETSKHKYSGFCIDLLEEIAEKVGFKFELYLPKINSTGGDMKGIKEEFRVRRADFAVGAIFKADIFLVKFSIPIYEQVGMLIMMKVPQTSKSFFMIIEVLDIGVWAVLVVLFFITSTMLWIFDKYSPYSYQNNKEALKDSDETREFTLKECFWFCLMSLTSQGGGEAPRCLSGKIVSGTWWFFGFIIIASYTANLGALLTATHLESSIDSLEALSKQFKVKYGVINSSRTMQYFETLSSVEQKHWKFRIEVPNSLYVKTRRNALNSWYTVDYPAEQMYTKMLKLMKDTKSMPNTMDEAIARVRASTLSDTYAFIGDASDIKFAVLTNCDLQSVGEEFNKQYYSIAYGNVKLKERIDDALMNLQNERKLDPIKNKWWRENPKVQDCGNRRNTANGISIQNVVGVFILIGGGVVVALIIMGLDKLWEKRRVNLKLEPKLEN